MFPESLTYLLWLLHICCYEQFHVWASSSFLPWTLSPQLKETCICMGAKFCGWERAVTLTFSWMSWQMLVLCLFIIFQPLWEDIGLLLGITETEDVCTETKITTCDCANHDFPFLVIQFNCNVFCLTQSALAWVLPFVTCCHIWWVDPSSTNTCQREPTNGPSR